jgi:outer membrane protein assembly factor BamB
VADGVVYVGSSDGTLYAYGVGCATGGASCTPLWKAQTTGLIESTPAVANGVVYVGTIEGDLYAFDAAGVIGCGGSPKTCTPLWASKAGTDIAAPPTVAGGVVYVGSSYYLYAFDAAGVSGCTAGMGPRMCNPLWMGQTGGSIESSPAVSGGVVYVGSEDGNLYAFDATGVNGCSGAPKTCIPLWTAKAGDPLYYPIVSSPAVANGVVYIGSYNGKLYAFDAAGVTGCGGSPKTCSPLWTGATGGNIDVSSPAVANGVVYIGSLDRKLYAFGTSCNSGGGTCTPLWTGDTGGAISSSPAVANGVVYVGSNSDKVHAYAVGCASAGGACTAIWTGASGSFSPAVSNGAVYVVSAPGKLYAFGLPKLDHIALSPSSPTITAGATQRLSAQGFDSAGNSLGDVTASTVFTISAGGSCAGALCTATVPGDYVVTATDATATAIVTLHVTADLPDHLVLSPARATITAGGQQSYVAQGFDVSGNSLGDVTALTTLTISAGGSCTGTSCTAVLPRDYVVTATYGSATGTASLSVTVGPLAGLTLTPLNASITVGASQGFTAQGFDASGNSLGDVTALTTFAISGGGSCSGTSCTSIVAGDHTITGSDGSATGTATLHVGAEPPASVVLSPGAAAMAAGSSQKFTAQGFDASGNSLGDVTALTTFAISGGGSCSGTSCTSIVAGDHTITGSDGGATGTATLNVLTGPLVHLVFILGTPTIIAGGTQTFTVQGFDYYGNSLGDVTASTTVTMSGGGSCGGTSCTSVVAGRHEVTGTDGIATGGATLFVSPGSLDHLGLTPNNAAITAGAGEAYSAQGFDTYGNSLGDVTTSTTFTISGSGSCSGTLCTAAVPGGYIVTGTDGAATGTATLQATTVSVVRLVVSPAIAGVPVGNSQTYTVQGFDASDNPLGDVTAATTFTISGGGSCGRSSCTPTVSGNHVVTATDGSASGTAALYAFPIDHLVLSPLSATASAGGSQTYTAIAYDSYGNYLGDVSAASTFAISGGGSCIGSTCTSAVAGSHTITATDGTASATATLVVTPRAIASLALSPASASIVAGGSQTYAAQAFDSHGNSLGDVTASTTFTMTGGSCTGSWCLGSVAGNQTVTATYGGVAGTASISVTPGPIAYFSISPLDVTIEAGGSVTFAVFGYDAYGNNLGDVTASTTFVMSGGSCSGSTCTSTLEMEHIVLATNDGVQEATPVYVTAGPVDSLAIFNPAGSGMTVGVSQPFSATGFDVYGNVVGDVTASTTFTISGGGYCYGTSCGSTIAGSHTATGTDGSATGSMPLFMAPGPAVTFTVSGFPSPSSAGSSHSVKVTALDAFGNVATGYRGQVHFASSDSKAVLPADYTFTSTDAGTHSLSVTLKTAGTESVTATDKATSTITGVQAGISVTPGAAKTFAVSGLPSPYGVGSTHTVTVTALDAYGNVATGYLGKIHFTSSDSKAVLPADYTFTSTDAGTHSFSVTLKSTGTRSLTATDKATSSITGSQSVVVATPGVATYFTVSGFPSPSSAGSSHSVKVTALDAFGNVATGYRGAIHFTSSDSKAVLPADYTFTSTDAGTHSFSVTLKTAGTESVTATDKATSTITGVQAGITVTPGAAKTFTASGLPSPYCVGSTHTVTVTALDAFGNVATGYRGAIHFTSSDSKAVLPADYTFTSTDAGTHGFSVTLKTAGMRSVTATDKATSSITGAQSVFVAS